ncbi:hypothetical protein Zm00014a_034615 [Zea mays]|nr:hypothetical protein Zm00014a_034615 [Zea mays]
MCCTTKL